MQQRTDLERTTLLGRHVLETIVASSSEAIALLDAQNAELPLVYANAAYESLTGRSADTLIGRPWSLLDEDSAVSPGLERLRIAARRGEACDVRLSGTRRDGTSWCGDVSLRALHTPDGEIEYLLCQYRAASAGAAAAEDSTPIEIELLRQAMGQARAQPRPRTVSQDTIDPVTGLLRYEQFMMLLAHDLGVARRDHHAVSLLAFEVVELDVYRRTFGDKAAESAMRMIGAQVAGAFRRASDSSTRRDDATILAAVIGQGPEQAAALAERVATKVRGLGLHNPRAASGRQLWVRHAVAGADPDSVDAAAFVEHVRARLAGTEPSATAETPAPPLERSLSVG